jgi:hypothetical protein
MNKLLASVFLLIIALAGCSKDTATSIITPTADHTAPTDPNLSANPVSAGRIDLIWTGSTDNVAVAEYEVWRGTSKITVVSSQSYSDIGLLAGTAYTYKVKAVDAAGNRSPGMNSVTAITAGTRSSIKLPQTGQTTCFDSSGVIDCVNTGQNGELQKGVAWPSPRFIANADTSISDALTGLIWAPNGNIMKSKDSSWDIDNVVGDGKVTWQHALDYISKLNSENYLGHNDWRLPNRKEIRSLVNYGQGNTSAWLNTQGFDAAELNFYWASTSAGDFGHSAWMISLGDGSVFEYFKATYDNCVWPVRGGYVSAAPADLPKTGQTTCSDSDGNVVVCAGTGQDGDYQKGISWPDPRFADNGNGTITDNLTGLVWAKDGNAPGPSACSPGSAMTWQNALDYVACLNTNTYLGYTDWRLPDVNELESLSNEGLTSVSSWLTTQGFINVQGRYWSSTSAPAWDISFARYVHMYNAMNYVDTKSSSNFVWPVRSGQ